MKVKFPDDEEEVGDGVTVSRALLVRDSIGTDAPSRMLGL